VCRSISAASLGGMQKSMRAKQKAGKAARYETLFQRNRGTPLIAPGRLSCEASNAVEANRQMQARRRLKFNERAVATKYPEVGRNTW